MRVLLLLCMFVSLVCGYSPSRRSYAYNPPPYGGDFGGQVVQQSQVESQPPQTISGQYWWQDNNNNSPFVQQQQQDNNNSPYVQQQQSDAVLPPMGICKAPVCPAFSVCVHWQLCHNGFLNTDGSGHTNHQIKSIPLQMQYTSHSCGSNMICCGVPHCNIPTPSTEKPITYKPTTQIFRDDIINTVTVTPPPPKTTTMMMMMKMRSPGNCPGGLYCVERPECDTNGFVINNPNMPNAVLPGVVPLLSCVVWNGNIQDGVCCQQVHPNPQGFD